MITSYDHIFRSYALRMNRMQVKLHFRIPVQRMRLLIYRSIDELAIVVSFALPALIRWIPEAQFPYPIGYDTPHYLAAAKIRAGDFNPFPLLYFILARLCNVGIDPIVSMKFIPTIIYGLLGLSSFLLAKRLLKWDNWKGLALVVTLALSPAMLRASWDLNRQMLALVFFISSLSLLRSPNGKGFIAFIGLSMLTAMSHQLIYGLMTAVQLLILLSKLVAPLRGKSVDVKGTSMIALSLTFSAAIFVGLWYRSNVDYIVAETFGTDPSRPQLPRIWPEKFTQLILFYHLGMAPLVLLGLFGDMAVVAWFAAAAVGSFSFTVPPYIPIYQPDRWFLILSYPISIFAANSLNRLRLGKPTPRRIVLAVVILIMCSSNSLPLLGLSMWPSLVPPLTGYVPGRMASSSVPIPDIEATRKLVQETELSDKTTALITHVCYSGWASYFNSDLPTLYFAEWYPSRQTVSQVLGLAKLKGCDTIYLLWYDDRLAEHLGFEKKSSENGLSLYVYGIL